MKINYRVSAVFVTEAANQENGVLIVTLNEEKFDPKKYEKVVKLRDGRTVLLRLIKPEDELLWLEMFQNFSEESVRYRFFYMIKDTPHKVRARYCDIDYTKEIGIVAELEEKGRRKILGVVRLEIESERKEGEMAFIVADPWQGLGLGSQMIDHMVEICKYRGLETVYALTLPNNHKAIRLLKKRGFMIKYGTDEAKATFNLKN